MSTPTQQAIALNPFSTRCVRPGAMTYVFSDGIGVRTLLDRLDENGWQGQIVGPHGSGKSTLLATLVPAIEQSGRRVVTFTLHDRQHRLPDKLASVVPADEPAVLMVDGYEQLSLGSRRRTRRFCARRGVGLIVTAHTSVGLPELFRTTTDLSLARRLVASLLPPDGPSLSPDEIDAAFARRQGNLRETLFDLYDVYERRRR
ncbi:MAG: hypothetical protein JW818_06440 [Pirellulales bacterium]|nr:hypothetical protein [Pirellulales bacterium]